MAEANMRRHWYLTLESQLEHYDELEEEEIMPLTVVLKSGHTFTGHVFGLTGTNSAEFGDTFGEYFPSWEIDLDEIAAIRKLQ